MLFRRFCGIILAALNIVLGVGMVKSFLLYVLLPPVGAAFVLFQVTKAAAFLAMLGFPVPTPAVIFRMGFAAYMLIPITLISVGIRILRGFLKKRRERRE